MEFHFTSILFFFSFLIGTPIQKEENFNKDICDVSTFKNRIKQKPEISLLFDNLKITKDDTASVSIKDFKTLDIRVDYITIDVPRRCYFFEKVQFILFRRSEREFIISENYDNLDDPINLAEVKSKFQPGDILQICPFPKLKNGYTIYYCPPVFNVKLK